MANKFLHSKEGKLYVCPTCGSGALQIRSKIKKKLTLFLKVKKRVEIYHYCHKCKVNHLVYEGDWY